MFPSEKKERRRDSKARRRKSEGSARPRYAETRAKAFRGLRFDWKFSQVRGFLGSDWSAPVERKFFPNDQAEVVTVNLAQPSPALLRPRRFSCTRHRVYRVTQKNNGRGATRRSRDNEKQGRERSITRGNGIDVIDRYAPRSQLMRFASERDEERLADSSSQLGKISSFWSFRYIFGLRSQVSIFY